VWDDRSLGPWIESLPSEVPLPSFFFTDDELAACQSPLITKEAHSIKESMQSSFEVVSKSFTGQQTCVL
jgi:hypothetical protein